VQGTQGGCGDPHARFILLVIAGLIGAVGILTNSQILIVAAMVVAVLAGSAVGAPAYPRQGDASPRPAALAGR
jgi:uncharacterized membrane protein